MTYELIIGTLIHIFFKCYYDYAILVFYTPHNGFYFKTTMLTVFILKQRC